MKKPRHSTAGEPDYKRATVMLITGCAALLLLGLLSSARQKAQKHTVSSLSRNNSAPAPEASSRSPSHFSLQRFGLPASAEEVVASKVQQFGRSRRAIVQSIALKIAKEIPPEIEEFFDALEEGDWEEIDRRFSALAKRSGQYEGSTHSPELDPFWPAVLEAYGPAEQAHLWPAQKLLDYGEAVLGSLRPGMVYVGGTDPGRFIPTLLNETSGGEPHIILTQNALADSRYLEYVRFQYADRFGLPSDEESKQIYEQYAAEAKERLEHDKQFPAEPKQIRPGENVKIVDGKVEVSGQTAVMAVNERLLQRILEKNPDASVALEESFPMKSTYATAAPLGPIIEIRARDSLTAPRPDEAAHSLDYWRKTKQKLMFDPEAFGSEATIRTYSHLAVAQANLLASQNYSAEAEEAYRLARDIYPASKEAAYNLAQLLSSSGRESDAQAVLAEFTRKYPDSNHNR
jgi:hypothetical protein